MVQGCIGHQLKIFHCQTLREACLKLNVLFLPKKIKSIKTMLCYILEAFQSFCEQLVPPVFLVFCRFFYFDVATLLQDRQRLLRHDFLRAEAGRDQDRGPGRRQMQPGRIERLWCLGWHCCPLMIIIFLVQDYRVLSRRIRQKLD